MTPSARLSAAIALLDEILDRKRPLGPALADWGKANRYAGSGDRNAIGNLVHDTLRVKASAQWIMGLRGETESGRCALIGMLRLLRGMAVEAIAALFTGERFAPAPLSEAEQASLQAADLSDAPTHIRGNYPEWLDAELARSFGETRVDEAAALASRAPVDARANALKLIRLKAMEALGHLEPEATRYSPYGLRFKPNAEGRAPYLQAEPAFIKGAVEIQDEGSQLASLLAGAKPGMQVLDFCAGGGGKTLAMAAEMNNRGQIFATDNDARRLAPIHERLTRAGVRNVQVRSPKGKEPAQLHDLAGKCDLVLVDAPCTGTGTWRRHPDAKWRLRPNALEMRREEQRAVLDEAKRSVKPGGRLVYITCSLLDAENGAQGKAFLAANPDFKVLDPAANARAAGLDAIGRYCDVSGLGLLLTPHRTDTDGFFICVLTRST
ncbi:MAG: RsmB/NOP family class I SAM-dependent RNA methyltransferase [Methylobacterium sp.]|jgi:16S rRNA (cytosine967-C5)-methyltransferase|nr:RsmB/NOP family class I SAM-dependent RNA methyltransferase [Methylobacterium sp.]